MTPEQVCALLRAHRLHHSTELELQNSIERLFIDQKVPYERERSVDERNRPDFKLADGVVIECKIGGGRAAIIRQIERYARLEVVSCVIVVTARAAALPSTVADTPILVVTVGTNWL